MEGGVGTRICVNNGEIETLIKKQDAFGLFVSSKYKVVRELNRIVPKQVVSTQVFTQTKLF